MIKKTDHFKIAGFIAALMKVGEKGWNIAVGRRAGCSLHSVPWGGAWPFLAADGCTGWLCEWEKPVSDKEVAFPNHN